MPRTKSDDEQPPKKGKKAPAAEPDAAPAAEQRPPTEDEIREGAAKLDKVMSLLGYEQRRSRQRPERMPGDEREDSKRNRARIRAVMLRYIQSELRLPTVQEICEATGLSDKTVKAHKKHIKLGDGSSNIYRALTHDVIMSIYRKARGYSYEAEKLLVVAGPKGDGSAVERHDITMRVHPDMAAAKLWLQAIEGMSDKSETKHSGEIKGGGGFHFEYVAPAPPTNE